MTSATNWKISTADYANNQHVALYLDPDEHEVYMFGSVGSQSTPHAAHTHQHVYLGAVPNTVDGAALGAWLQACVEMFDTIASCYEGTTWDCRGHVGSWSSGYHDAIDEFGTALDGALSANEIQCRWDAGDFYAQVGDPEFLKEFGGDLDAAIVEAMSVAAGDDIMIDEDDLREYVVARLAELAELADE